MPLSGACRACTGSALRPAEPCHRHAIAEHASPRPHHAQPWSCMREARVASATSSQCRPLPAGLEVDREIVNPAALTPCCAVAHARLQASFAGSFGLMMCVNPLFFEFISNEPFDLHSQDCIRVCGPFVVSFAPFCRPPRAIPERERERESERERVNARARSSCPHLTPPVSSFFFCRCCWR